MNAPPAKVYEAWTDAKKITHWFGPENAEVLRATTDVRVGGRSASSFVGPTARNTTWAAPTAK